MNSLVFNTTASNLRASVYGYNQDTDSLQLLQLNNSGELLVAGDFTVNGDVTITNDLLTVAGDVTITNTLLTIAGEVTVSGDVTIANTLLTVFLEGNQFTSNTESLANVTTPSIALAQTDISNLRTGTFFINNEGNSPITVSLQLSPDGANYFDSTNYTDIPIDGLEKTIFVVDIFAHYAQLQYDPGDAATFSVYFNGQA